MAYITMPIVVRFVQGDSECSGCCLRVLLWMFQGAQLTAKKEKNIKFKTKLKFPFFNSFSFFTYLLKSP